MPRMLGEVELWQSEEEIREAEEGENEKDEGRSAEREEENGGGRREGGKERQDLLYGDGSCKNGAPDVTYEVTGKITVLCSYRLSGAKQFLILIE